MRPALKLCLALIAITALSASGLARAEGEPYDANTPAPKPLVKRRKVTARPAPLPVLPDAPIPYTTLGLSPDMAKALTPDPPAALDPLPPPVVITAAPLPVQPAEAPPPVAASAPTAFRQISLKCETQVTEGKRFVSQGVFYIDLFPSPVFPDEHADFKFLRVDSAHQSLIRDSICLDIGGPATVTGSAYYLVNRITKHGGALRITLDRSNGAFYAEEITSSHIGTGSHRGEKGFCTPQAEPAKLF